MNERLNWRYILPAAAILLAGLYVIGLAFDFPDWINGRNWEWVRRIPGQGERIIWLFLIFLLAIGLWYWTGREGQRPKRQTALLLLWAVLMTPLLQLAVAGQHRSQSWSVIFLSTTTSGFYQDGVQITEPVTFIRDHLDNMRGYRDVHVRTQPPGWQITYWAMTRAAERLPGISDPVGRSMIRTDCLAQDVQGLSPAQASAAVLSLSILLWSGLGALPFWWLARYFLEERPRRLALLIYPFWPGFLVFTGRFDVLYAVLALFALWLAQHTLLTGRKRTAVLFGLIMAGATWFGLGTLAIVGLVNLLLLAQILLKTAGPPRAGFIRLVALNGTFLAFLVALWGGLWLFLGVDGPAIFSLSQELHQKFRIIYPLWPLFNLFDLAVFMGIVAFAGAFAGLIRVGGQYVRGKRTFQPAEALVLGWVAVVILLNLSGQVRAETGRLWLFLMGPGLLAGVTGWTLWLKGAGRNQRGLEGALLIAFMIQAIVTGLFLGGRAPKSTVPEPVWQISKDVEDLAFELGDSIALRGYQLKEVDGRIQLDLYWQALDYPRDDYVVFAHLVDNNGEIIAQDDGPPLDGGLPTWCWVPGEVVLDQREFLASDIAQNGAIGIGLYDWRTGDRLPISPPLEDDVLFLSLNLLQ